MAFKTEISDREVRDRMKEGTYPANDCSCRWCVRARELQAEDAVVDRLTGPLPAEDAAVDEANPKDAIGAAKPSMGLIPVGAMEGVARVMELGAKKYGPYNWRTKKVKLMVYANAGLRHLFKWIGGESVDPESGQPHLAHVAACMMICLDAMVTGNAIDDRTWPHD